MATLGLSSGRGRLALRRSTRQYYVLPMFRPLRLAEAFEHVATADEWRWFGPMVARRVMHFGLDGWPLYTQDTLRRYDDLYRKLLIRVHDKLRSGEWLARGISPSLGPESRPIDPALWDYMDIVHRTEFAEGGGHRLFIAAIAGVQTVRPPVPQAATALLRAQLTRFLLAPNSLLLPGMRSQNTRLLRTCIATAAAQPNWNLA